MENMKLVCVPGYPLSRGTVTRALGEAFLVKASIGGGAHAITPMHRVRQAGAVVAPNAVQTTDRPTVLSALTRERRT